MTGGEKAVERGAMLGRGKPSSPDGMDTSNDLALGDGIADIPHEFD